MSEGSMKLIVSENGESREVDLTGSVLDIGRGSENQVVIKDPRSSRRHCRVRQTPQGWILEDLKSRNGTTLNGSPVAQNLLKSGDEFRIGNARFRFEGAVASVPSPVSSPPGPPEGAVASVSSPPGPPGGAVASAPAASSGRAAKAEGAAKPQSTAKLEAPARPSGQGPRKEKEIVILEEAGDEPAAPETSGAVSNRAVSDSQVAGDGEFFLEGVDGAHFGKRIPITHLPFTIGRKPQNDFHLDDHRASGHHARIVERKGRYWVEDLESTNGTLLNHRKIRAAALGRGALLRIGDSTFRVEMPAAPAAASGPETEAATAFAESAGEVAEDEFSHFNAREFFEAGERTGAPMQVVAILLVLGTLLYFTVDVTMKMVRPKDPDPAASGNLIPNWSFEATAEGSGSRAPARAAIPGWTAESGAPASIALSPEGHQYPGRLALRLSADGEGLCRAAATDVHIDPTKGYRLLAHVENRQSFAAGVMVSWLEESGGERVEVARSWGSALSEAEGSEDIERPLKPPPSAVFARVMPFVIAAGRARGSGLFDQVFLGEFSPEERPVHESAEPTPQKKKGRRAASSEEAAVAEPLPMEITDGGGEGAAAQAGGAKGPPIRLLVTEDGSVRDLRRGPRSTIQVFWVGLPAAADPLALGQRISTRLRQSSEREGAVFSCQLPDLEKGEWRPIEARVRSQPGEILCEYRFQGEAGQADQAALYLDTAPLVKEAVGLGGSLGLPTHFRLDQPAEGTMDELIFGGGAEQIVLLFSTPVKLSTISHPESHGRTLLVATVAPPTEEAAAGGRTAERSIRALSVRISSASRREKEAAAALLARAAQFRREGKPAEARNALTELASRFPWRQADLARAEEMEKGWNAEAERALKEIQLGLQDLTASPAPVIRDALLARVAELLKVFPGSPAEPELKAVEEKIRRLVPEKARTTGEADPAALLSKVKAHLENEELGFAALCLNLAKGLKLDAGLKLEAQHLEEILAERRTRRASEEVR
jgi:pSer/pThr/pTyr-binding forkhead associated (FHA) protein